MTRDQVTAVLVTRGDVDLQPILDSLIFDDVQVWDNSDGFDFGAYGRYHLAATAARPVIYTQDDDCIVSRETQRSLVELHQPGVVLSNMNENHNAGKRELALPGWGCLFDADLVEPTFKLWGAHEPHDVHSERFIRVGCDIVFPILNRSRMIDLGHDNLPYAWAENRTHVQPGYGDAKEWYYQRALSLRSLRVDDLD